MASAPAKERRITREYIRKQFYQDFGEMPPESRLAIIDAMTTWHEIQAGREAGAVPLADEQGEPLVQPPG